MNATSIVTKVRELVQTVVVTLVLAFGFQTGVASAFYIPSGSMLPTLEIGDRLVIEKLSRRLGDPHRGDIVVFDPPPKVSKPPSNAWVKRVVGLPGERVGFRDGRVTLDGRVLPEVNAWTPSAYPEPDWEGLGMPGGLVPAGHVFVMGDNRNNSADGHVWGALPIAAIIGRSVFRYWPPLRVGVIPAPDAPGSPR